MTYELLSSLYWHLATW